MPRWKPLGWGAGLLTLMVLGVGGALLLSNRTAQQIFQALFVPFDDQQQVVATVIESEELLLLLTPELRRLSQGVLNLRLPDVDSAALMAESVEAVDLAPSAPHLHEERGDLAVRVMEWEIASQPAGQSQNAGTRSRSAGTPSRSAGTWPRSTLALWQPLLSQLEYFEAAKFYFIRGQFLDPQRTRWEARVGFTGLARHRSGRWWGLKGTQQVTWRKSPDPQLQGAAAWRIASWRQLQLKCYETPRRLFAETLDEALPDKNTLNRARQSLHEELVVRLATDREYRPDILPVFDHFSTDRHPGLAVVDLDADGWDDLYLMNQWGRNLLLHNRGDGSFDDVAPQWGLDLENHSTSAVFADFDNDGDPDAFVGRSLEQSLYLENEGGRFVDRSRERVGLPLPRLVSSISAADYNGDGLLDVYFSTYAGDLVIRSINALPAASGQGETPSLLPEFLPADQAQELFRRSQREGHQMMSRVGPPNLLLINRGGTFERSPESDRLAVWRNTFQATWGDYDGDGDADLYVANDFSPNNLFRNQGDGTFTDVTEATQTADIGFGMGAAWGDYDNDGRQDLYVSNMYSKAGQRITGQLGELVDARFQKMASGNSLFRNEGAAFRKVSGVEPPALAVEMAGWSWGGQFLDVNNDGYLDLFATNGYYTAPPAIAVDVDL